MLFTGLVSLYSTSTHTHSLGFSHQRGFSNQKTKLLSVASVSCQETSGIKLTSFTSHQSYNLTLHFRYITHKAWGFIRKYPVSSRGLPLLPSLQQNYCLNMLDYHMMWRHLFVFLGGKKSCITHWHLFSFVIIGSLNTQTCNGPAVLPSFLLCSRSLHSSFSS